MLAVPNEILSQAPVWGSKTAAAFSFLEEHHILPLLSTAVPVNGAPSDDQGGEGGKLNEGELAAV